MNRTDLPVREPGEIFIDQFAESGGRPGQIRFQRNEKIYNEDDEAHYWYKVVSGAVRACNLLADGRRHVSAFFLQGDFFGFDEAEKYLASTEAVTDVILNRYPRAVLKNLSVTDPSLAQELQDLMVKSVAGMCRRMTLLARKTALERVASFLLDMAERAESGSRVELPMTRHDIADHLGLTFETICRAISFMKRSGVIRIPENAHQIDLVDHQTLKAMQAGGDAGFMHRAAEFPN